MLLMADIKIYFMYGFMISMISAILKLVILTRQSGIQIVPMLSFLSLYP